MRWEQIQETRICLGGEKNEVTAIDKLSENFNTKQAPGRGERVESFSTTEMSLVRSVNICVQLER